MGLQTEVLCVVEVEYYADGYLLCHTYLVEYLPIISTSAFPFKITNSLLATNTQKVVSRTNKQTYSFRKCCAAN